MMVLPIGSNDRYRLAARVLGALVALAPAAHAQAASPDAETRAQQLFDEARALMRDGRYSEACSKLEESQKLDPGGGTLLNLGICHEKEGRTATAFRELTDALAVAGRDHRADREKTASKHLDALAAQLSRLTLTVSSDVACTSVVVKIDDVELAADDAGKALPLDPGKHRVTATATGCKPWSSDVVLGAAADEQVLSVALVEEASSPPAPITVAPPLPAAERAPTPTTPELGSHDPGASLRVTGYVIGSAGLAAVGVGAYFGISALVLKSRSDDVCPDGHVCTAQSGVSDWNDAKTHALIADVAIGAGLVAVGVGTYFVIRGSKERPARSVSLSLSGVPSGAVASCAGTF
jgi:tetratricopeptide (TPR) repeat protein